MVEYLQILFSKSWEFFMIPFPGTSIPIGMISLGALTVSLSIKILEHVLGISFGIKVSSHLRDVKGGNNSKIKVSEKRRNDTR